MIAGMTVTGKWMGAEFTGTITHTYDYSGFTTLIIALDEAIAPVACPPKSELMIDVNQEGTLVNSIVKGFVTPKQ